MRLIGKTLLATAAGAAVLAYSAVSASAVVVCVTSSCWHSQERYDYPSSAHVVVHEDNWKWRKNEHYRWREHSGRGYWSGERWTNW